ncbi:hypothetical protein Scep_023681 [Stephania cephalantha]|uniref:Uncharacterized protein n=1 Tax=Stephania cephalantha TaxID=152367 RepID=A0AAP0EV45_9MAGN
MEDVHVGNDDVQHGEERMDSSDYHDYTNEFIPEAPFASRHETVSWVQKQGCNRKFVIVTKNSDASGDDRCRGMVNMACERSGLIGVRSKELRK